MNDYRKQMEFHRPNTPLFERNRVNIQMWNKQVYD